MQDTALVAGLRHRIVHTRGVVSDREEFVKTVLGNCGLWNQGNPKHENRALVEAYLARDADEWVVSLAEQTFGPNGVPIDMYYDVGGWLIADLVAHAVAISRCVQEGFGDD